MAPLDVHSSKGVVLYWIYPQKRYTENFKVRVAGLFLEYTGTRWQ